MYGIGNVQGIIGKDTVCLTNSEDICADHFEFYIVEEAGDGIFTDATNIDGICGLSPYMEADDRNPNPFIKTLYD